MIAAVSPVSILKIIGGPGSLGFLAVACIVGFLLMHIRPQRTTLGRVWLFGTFLLYVILGFPLVAHFIADSLPAAPSEGISRVRSLDELIVLGGDNEDGRVTQTINAWRTVRPHVVLLLGDRTFAQRIAEAGVPRARIRHDDGPRTTRAQMEWVQAELRDHPVGKAGLIASRLQMPRVIELARTHRLHVLFLPSPLDHEPAVAGMWSFIPSYGALEMSRDALYERAALAYYRSRGWIEAEP